MTYHIITQYHLPQNKVGTTQGRINLDYFVDVQM